MDKKPALNPDNPQQIAHNKTVAGNQSIVNQVNGSNMVNDFVEGETNVPEPVVPNPYTIQSGGKKSVYKIVYKHISKNINAKNHLDALDKGYEKMKEYIKGKKSVIFTVQKYNKNRENHVYKYKVTIVKIKNPNHQYKVNFTKI